MAIDLDNQTAHYIDLEFLEAISQDVTKGDIELLVTTNNQIQEINKEFRNIDKPTDVLSFPYESMPFSPIGSVAVSVDFVEEKANEYGHSFEDEFSLLYIHGLLHLIGYDHEVDNGEHRKEEERLIKQFNLPNSLIVRNS